MNDKQMIEQLYHDMYSAMVKKDEAELDRVHDESFVLIHMTGMHQDKSAYIRAIMEGTADEMANIAELLISDAGAFITGSTFLADGGATASYYYGPLQPDK